MSFSNYVIDMQTGSEVTAYCDTKINTRIHNRKYIVTNRKVWVKRTVFFRTKTQHLLGETVNCHIFCESLSALSANCSLLTSHISTIRQYNLRSFANNYAVMPYCSRTAIKSLMKTNCRLTVALKLILTLPMC